MTPVHHALVARLAGYDRPLEVGVGRRPAVAGALAARGAAVLALDVHQSPVPTGVAFVRADVVDLADRLRDGGDPPDLLRGVDAVYALNLPPELHRPVREVAHALDADLLFTTLGGDQPTVPVRRESLSGEGVRETLFVDRAADRRGPGRGR